MSERRRTLTKSGQTALVAVAAASEPLTLAQRFYAASQYAVWRDRPRVVRPIQPASLARRCVTGERAAVADPDGVGATGET